MKNRNPKLIIAGLALIAIAAAAIAMFARSSPAEPLMFGRVVFGMDKSNPAAVYHFIVRGPEIFVDANKDNTPQPAELCDGQKLDLIRDDKTEGTYLVHELRLSVNPKFVSESLPQQLSLTCEVDAGFQYQQIGTVTLSTNPLNPSWSHFDGPTKIVFTDPGLPLHRDGKGTEVRVWVGTSAEGQGIDLGTIAAVKDLTDTPDSLVLPEVPQRFAHVVPVPGKPVPTATIEFATDGSPFIEQLMLDDFC